MAVGIRHANHVAPSICKKLAITWPTSDGRSIGIVRSPTQTLEFSFFLDTQNNYVYMVTILADMSFSNLFKDNSSRE
jgi:hypothetical protein